ncbi:winged helix-turn-helix domain-containing protein [Halovivax gelatinilyticus]|uniref:winged helix-turn-helix domain-containing protein n=1 Tax=Halovivax gelatinilyticus TaxID=2961597 RepID=UPI0020CA8071|nr:helix-turn-helix domain-containing protein [Halovivax gelatinilyticus]
MGGTELSPEFELERLSPDEAFAILGNDTRLDILRSLWEAGAHHEYDDIEATATTISFSELQQAVGIRDNGQFNYHLSQLIPSFVRHTDEGYRLSGAGKEVFRTLIAISGEQNSSVPDDLESPCPVCGGTLTAVYEDQWLRVMCTDCDGNFGDATPDGTVFNTPFPAAGLTDRTPDEAFLTGNYRCMLDMTYLMRKICRECASPLTSSVSICEDHDATRDRSCTICVTDFPVWGDLRCDTCRYAKRLPVELCAMGLTPVITFLHEQDIDVLSSSFRELGEVIAVQFQTAVTSDPLRVTVTINNEPDELTVTFDDKLSVVESTC